MFRQDQHKRSCRGRRSGLHRQLTLVGMMLCVVSFLLADEGPLPSGLTNETSMWQKQIDDVAAHGGGCVLVPKGRHLVSGLNLRSNVELHLDQGAVLEGDPDAKAYPIVDLPFSEGRWQAVVMGVSVTNVAITGRGCIFGNGACFPMPAPFGPVSPDADLRPRGIFIGNSTGIRLSDFTLKDAGSWGCVVQCCSDVEIRSLVIDSHANLNNDGIDIEARHVVVADCDIDSGDDGICLKSNNPGFEMEDVLITNCVVRSYCVPLKIGTATHGVVRNVAFRDCRIEAPRRDCRLPGSGRMMFGRDQGWERAMPGWKIGVSAAASAIAVECVDGGAVEDVSFKDIKIEGGVMVPVFVRANRRMKRMCGTPRGDKNVLRRISFENITGFSVSGAPSSVSGVPSFRVCDVTFRNVHLTGLGCGDLKVPPVPECEDATPSARMFGQGLPAYGLWARHIDGLALENTTFTLVAGMADSRPPVVQEDVSEFSQQGKTHKKEAKK